MRNKQAIEFPFHLIDHEAERFVMGSLLRSWSSEYASMIDEQCFASADLSRLWSLCERLVSEKCIPCSSEVMRVSMAEKLGFTFAWILDLYEQGIPDAVLTKWVDRLRDLSKQRQAFAIAEQLQVGGPEAIEDARRKLHDLERIGGDSKPATIGAIVQEEGGEDAVLRAPEGLIEPPFNRLRSVLSGGGFAPQSVTILAARPSDGKTAFAWQLALCAAMAGHRTALFSLEMGRRELLRRIWAERCGIPLGQLFGSPLTALQRAAIRHCDAELDDCPLEMLCNQFSLQEITQTINRRKDPFKFVVIDYLGLIATRRKFNNQNEELTYISRKIKELAMSRDIPILALHQLNRAQETDGGRRPQLSDLRGSGSLEQDADNVLFIYRPAARRGSDENPHARQLIVAKQRNGRRDIAINYTFQGEFVRFVEDN